MRMAIFAGWSWLLLLLSVVSPLCALQGARPARPEAKGEPLQPDWCGQLPRPGYKALDRVSLADHWFEVYRIRPGVFAIYEPHQYEEVISYLIVGSQRALLFDTGMGMGDLRKIVTQLTRLPIIVLNSHTHFDHIGDNWQFQTILGVNISYTRHNAGGATHEQLRDAVIPERFCGDLPPGFKPEGYAIPPFKISSYVKEGEVLDLGDRKVEVLLTPGHAPDALCLLDRKNRLLFTGDTFYAGPIFLYIPDTDVTAYGRSIEKLAKLVPQLDLLLPSHNFPEAKPEMLTRLSDAFRQVQSGKAQFTLTGGRREYKFDGFSLLMAGTKK
ncbi:MAG: MBL fold metallo-hydrolase [Acidobacteriia bacterium]|nr:MBL fold metallo-hydrolase [Terriglobia bacterium]